MQNLPLPSDIPLEIPGNISFFTALLVISFLLHIFFVSFLVAGSIMAVVTQIIGIRTGEKKYDTLAQKMATLTSFNKSIAVVLGVAPLLLISVLYTSFFYSSSILIGNAWLSVIWMTIIGFWALYAYKFTWDRMENRRGLHLAMGIFGAIVFMLIPFIFVTNIQLMNNPERWLPTQEGGFFYALSYPIVWIKYMIFMLSTFTVAGVGLALYARYRKKLSQEQEETEHWNWAMRYGLKWALYPIIGQVIALPLYMLNLPDRVASNFFGGNIMSTLAMIIAVVGSLLTVFYLYRGITRQDIERLVVLSTTFVIITGLAIGTVRQQIRAHYVEPYEKIIEAKSEPNEDPKEVITNVNQYRLELLRYYQNQENEERKIIQVQSNPDDQNFDVFEGILNLLRGNQD